VCIYRISHPPENSGPNSSQSSTAVYDGITGITGFSIDDSWAESSQQDNGYTCCYPPELDESAGYFSRRIDHIFYINSLTNYLRVSGALVTETDNDEKIFKTDKSRIWASDHGGMITGFNILSAK